MKHEGKRRELYEKPGMHADISDVALFLDEHEEMLERGTLPNCGTCNTTCNPCQANPRMDINNKIICTCKNKTYCIKKGDDCKVNAARLLEQLEPYIYIKTEKLKMMCSVYKRQMRQNM